MPTYEYRCQQCRKKFSLTMGITEHGRKKPACPKCKSKKVRQQISGFTAITSKKS
ncbi:MAG: zinc ribbon domain-containing protein [Thermodesulfobacteriota bacterium]